MSPQEWERVWDQLFGYRRAFDYPIVARTVVAVVVAVSVAGIAIQVLRRTGRISDESYRDTARWHRWT